MTTNPDTRSDSSSAIGGPHATAREGERSMDSSPSSPETEDAVLDAYTYGLLDPRAGAAGDNMPLLGATTLGVEVTVPELARLCGLGNVDPQHGGGLGVGAAGAVAAIEACLAVTPPLAGATLVTVRPDLDAFGAMALLALRRAGRRPDAGMRSRIDRAARADRFDHGPWPGPRPLPTTGGELAFATNQDPALVAVTGAMFDRERSVRERVGVAARWLATGAEPAGYRERWNARAAVLIDGLASHAVAVESAAEGRIAVMASRIQGSLRLGYCLAPVVVAHDPGSPAAESPAPRRIVIAQYAPGHVDLGAVRDALGTLEPGWGGSSTILGSPQGRPCGLALVKVVEVVARHLRPVGDETRAESVIQ